MGGRKIRIWTRDGILHSTSENVTGLESALDWRWVVKISFMENMIDLYSQF